MMLSLKRQAVGAHLPVALVLSLILTGCSDGGGSTPESPAQSTELHGIWERVGYGDVLVVDGNGAEHYQYTRQSCLEADSLDNDEIAEIFHEPQFSNDQSILTVKPLDSLAFSMRLQRLEVLPASCLDERLLTASTATATFEHVWHTFNDHYAFFNERDVDWNALYADLKPYVTDDLSDDDLLEVFEALLEPLDDGHVQLNADGDSYSFEEYRGANQVIVNSFPDQTDYDDIQDYANAVSSKYIEIRSSYLDAGTEKTAGGEDDDGVMWGTISQKIGYMRVARMEELSSDEDSVEAELTAVNTIMTEVLADLGNTEALIIDVRVNGGGQDAVSLAIANYFADQKRLAVSKYARSYLGNTEPVEAYLQPANDTPYLNPIAVIGSPDTASAAEIFLMAMSALPHVTLVGENSNGILSDILSKSLPNEWEIGLSNEVYTDYLDVNHEVTGVPPAVQAPTFSLEAMAEGRDAAIDAALEVLGFAELQRGS